MEKKEKKEKKHSKLKVFFIIIAVILILLLIGVGIGYSFINSKLNKINYYKIDENTIEVTEGVTENLSGYRNIVLFGIDDADGYTGRSDCIIIFSINEQTKKGTPCHCDPGFLALWVLSAEIACRQRRRPRSGCPLPRAPRR